MIAWVTRVTERWRDVGRSSCDADRPFGPVVGQILERGPVASGPHRGARIGARPGRWELACLGLLVLVFGLYLAIGWISPGLAGDTALRKGWARWLDRRGLRDAYDVVIDYPPASLYLFRLSGLVYREVVDPTFDRDAANASQTFTFVVKLPWLMFHPLLMATMYLLVLPRGRRAAILAAAVYGLNPAVAYDVAYLGQTDTTIGAFSVAGLGALVAGQPGLAGALLTLAGLSKPQTWVFMPIAVAVLARWYGLRGLGYASLTATGTLLVVLVPWIVGGRLQEIGQFFTYLVAPTGESSTAISANAHNLWWLPTLARWDWIGAREPLLGPVSYGQVALLIVAGWLVLCLRAAIGLRRREDLYLVAGATTFGFFTLMVRAHENHGYLAVPLLAMATAFDRRRWPLYALTTAALLLNLVLRDPLLVGAAADVPYHGHSVPGPWVLAQLVNVALNLFALGLLARALVMLGLPGPTVAAGRSSESTFAPTAASELMAVEAMSPARGRSPGPTLGRRRR